MLEDRKYIIKSIVDFSNKMGKGDEIVSVSVDKSGISTLIIHSAPQYRIENEIISVINSKLPKDYTFIRHDLNGKELFRTLFKDKYFYFHSANYLPTNEILLVCRRVRYKNNTEIESNARIYDLKGELIRDFIAGDGIQDVKVDSKGNIWTSYFDEGIFGDCPIGVQGLVCWNKDGKKIWEFEPTNGLDYIADCYAMNIDSDDNTWFYYYTEFPLVKLNSSKQIEFWETKLRGSSSLNISKNMILMTEGYSGDNFILFEIKGKKLKTIKRINFQCREGIELKKQNYVTSFGSNIGFINQNKIYLASLDEIK